jgi:exodeoxyribonuclease VII small subunit
MDDQLIDDAPGFEDALRRLEQTVKALETGDLGLDDALATYGQGVRLLAHCQGLLNAAERQVALLTGVSDDGSAETVPFDARPASGPGSGAGSGSDPEPTALADGSAARVGRRPGRSRSGEAPPP